MSAESLYSAGRNQIDRDDQTLVRALKDRDERVFNELAGSWSSRTLRLALILLDQACRLLITLVGDIGDDHARTLPGERQRRRPTDAARPAGDE